MARMSIDDSALRNPSVLRLAKRVGWSRRETLGALLDVWAVSYDRATPFLPREDIDVAAERDGFADDLIAVGLASDTPDGIKIRGAEDRVRYLTEQAERGRKGGLTRAANERERSEANKTQAYASRGAQAGAQASFKPPDPVPDPARSISSTLVGSDLFSPSEPQIAHDPTKRQARAPRPKGDDYTTQELADVRVVLDKLGAFSGVRYQGGKHHTALIVRHLRSGLTAWDLRRVAGYCAMKLGWEQKPNMQPFLRPETLFGPETIERYLDAARAWEPATEPPEARPQLRLVTEPEQLALAAPEEHEPYNDNEDLEEPEWMTNS